MGAAKGMGKVIPDPNSLLCANPSCISHGFELLPGKNHQI
jgi:hypothetical protein